jgi:hypothetical protein
MLSDPIHRCATKNAAVVGVRLMLVRLWEAAAETIVRERERLVIIIPDNNKRIYKRSRS